MRYAKRYIAFFVIVALAFFIKLNHWSDEYGRVDVFRGAQLEETVFYPLIAKSANLDHMLTVYIDGEQTAIDGFRVGDDLNLQISTERAMKVFGCSAKVYDDGLKVITNGEAKLYDIDEVTRVGELYYVPVSLLENQLGFQLSWIQSSYTAEIDMTTSRGRLPSSFDLREQNRAASIRDQGSDNTCWALAALEAMESSLLPTQSASFNAAPMVASIKTGDDGGNYAKALGYLVSWQGPTEVMETDYHVQEAQFFDTDDIDAIKWAVYQVGGVSTSIYVNVGNVNESAHYEKKNNTYCYLGSNAPNHEVVIIGWDDTFPASKFGGDVPGNGAFICQNSWGDNFGEKGVFYVSYYDSNVGSQSVCYTKIQATDNYDHIYQSDLMGWNGHQLGYKRQGVSAANVFTATSNEQLMAAGFYALGKNTEYHLYVSKNVEDANDFGNRHLVAEGTLENAGYYTIPFSAPVNVSEGERYALILVISTPQNEHPMAVELEEDGADISDGEGYLSVNGLIWERVEEKAKANLCLKAYSVDVVEEVTK